MEIAITVLAMLAIGIGLYMFITRDKGDSAPTWGEGGGSGGGRNDSDQIQH